MRLVAFRKRLNKNLKKKGTPLCDKVFSDQTNTTKDGVPYEKQYKVF